MGIEAPTAEFYDKLSEAVEFFNKELFDGQLPKLMITVQRTNKSMGFFSPDRWVNADGQRAHELAINPAHLASNTLLELFQTICHELCHLWQYTHGTPPRPGYHNAEWRDKMIEIGLQPSSTGLIGGKTVGQQMSDYPLIDGKFLKISSKLIDEMDWAIPWIDRQCRAGIAPSVTDRVKELMLAQAEAKPRDEETQGNAAEVNTETDAASSDPDDGSAANESSTSTELLSTSPPHHEMISELPEVDTVSLVKGFNPEVSEESIQALLGSRVVEHLPETAEIEIPEREAVKKAKRKSKLAYHCGCGGTVWAKPNMHVICGRCNERFVSEEEKPISGPGLPAQSAAPSITATELDISSMPASEMDSDHLEELPSTY